MRIPSAKIMTTFAPVGQSLTSTAKRPVFAFLTTVMILVSVLYFFGVLKSIPCGPGVINGLNRTFIHANWQHIMANMFVFFLLSQIEEEYGSAFFASLIIQIATVSAILELFAHQFFHIPCAVGFSGVLFGLTAWKMMTGGNPNFILLLTLVGMVIAPRLESSKVSLVGHAIGTISGLLVAMYYKPGAIFPTP